MDARECAARLRAAKEAGQAHFYLMELAPGLVLDARRKGTLARLLNSSCAPNCETQKWHDAGTGEVRVGIFAAAEIAPGAELTYDYQFQHAGLASDAGAYRRVTLTPTLHHLAAPRLARSAALWPSRVARCLCPAECLARERAPGRSILRSGQR